MWRPESHSVHGQPLLRMEPQMCERCIVCRKHGLTVPVLDVIGIGNATDLRSITSFSQAPTPAQRIMRTWQRDELDYSSLETRALRRHSENLRINTDLHMTLLSNLLTELESPGTRQHNASPQSSHASATMSFNVGDLRQTLFQTPSLLGNVTHHVEPGFCWWVMQD